MRFFRVNTVSLVQCHGDGACTVYNKTVSRFTVVDVLDAAMFEPNMGMPVHADFTPEL